MTPAEFKSIRKSLGLSQPKMARRLGDESGGYSLRAVQDWEYGKRPIPPCVRRLMREFGKGKLLPFADPL